MFDETTEAASRDAQIETLATKAGEPPLLSRARAVLLRLVAGGPAFTFYERVRDRLDVIEERSRVAEMVADEVERLASVHAGLVQRAKGRLLGDMVARQDNLEVVALAALARLEAAAQTGEPSSEDFPEPSADWLNAFAREAEIASSDRLRDRLSQILASEIEQPGRYRRGTVRFVAETEEEVLEAFAAALQHRLGDAIIRDPAAWNEGEWFERGRILESEGLIAGHEGFTRRTITLDPKGNGFFLGEEFGLVAQGTPGSSRSVSIWILTWLGQQVASLLPSADEYVSAVRLAKLMPKEQLSRIAVGPWFSNEDGRYTVASPVLLWDRR